MFALSDFNRFVGRIFEYVLGVAFLTITVVLCFNVIFRYLFNFSFFWAAELTNYIVIWVTLLGSALCVRHGYHMSVDVLLLHLKGTSKIFIKVLGILISLTFVILLCIFGIQQVAKLSEFGQITPAMQIPMYWPYLAIPLGSLFMVLAYLEKLAEAFQDKQ